MIELLLPRRLFSAAPAPLATSTVQHDKFGLITYEVTASNKLVVTAAKPVTGKVSLEGPAYTISWRINNGGNQALTFGKMFKHLSAIELHLSTGSDNITLGRGLPTTSVFAGQGDDDVVVLAGIKNKVSIDGGEGDDRLLAIDADAGVVLTGGAGDDRLEGTRFADKLNGGDGADHLNGFAGNDTLLGEAGKDVLNAGSGLDKLDGGGGTDILTATANDHIAKDPLDRVRLM